MKKSIFTKYISAFLLIIFISFAVLTMIISSMTIRSENTQKQTIAENTADYITEYLISEFNSFFVPDFERFVALRGSDISNMINILSKNADLMTIFITSPDGRILISTEGVYSGSIADESILESLTATTKSRFYTDMGGMLDRKYGVLVTPFQYGNLNVYAGALIVCYSAGTPSELSINTVRTIIIASLWVMIASLVAIYFITQKIVSPIRQMTYATRKFAKGKFDVKIPADGEDEIAELATAFNSMADALANFEYTRSSFLANVSHDLRTPMTSISGFIDGILEGAIPPEKQPYYLEIIRQEVQRLSRLVSSLLDISRMESGNRKFEKTPFDICEMARIILLSFEAKIDAKKLDVEFETSSDRLLVYSDKDAINQVIYNLCDNAVKFARDGGKYRISITEEQGKAVVRIYNEGVGIAAADLPHVFDRFYKSDKSRGLDKTGVGLGLYICKTIMDNLGEDISVTSHQNEFCEFTVSLTRYKDDKNTARRVLFDPIANKTSHLTWRTRGKALRRKRKIQAVSEIAQRIE